MNQLSQPVAADITAAPVAVRFDSALKRLVALADGADLDVIVALVDPCQRAFLLHTLDWVRESGEAVRLGLRLRRGADWVAAVADVTLEADAGVTLTLARDDVAAARRAEAQFRQLVENAQQAVTVMVGEQVVFINHALAALVGYGSLAELRATGGRVDHTHPDDRDMIRRRTAARAAGLHPPESYEFRMVRVDGAEIWVDCWVSAVTWNGQPASMAWLIDITDRKQTAAALQRSEKLFSAVFQACPDLMSLSRLDNGRIVDVNRSFVRQLGYERDVAVGRQEREIGLFLDANTHHRLLTGINENGAPQEIVARVRTRDGEHLDLAMSCEPIRIGDRDLLLTVGRDVTEQLRVEDELRHSKESAVFANRAKSEFLANMSHELRTPLNAIIGFAEVLSEQLFGPLGNDRYVDYVRDIQDSGRHLLQIINDLLDLSKLEAGKQDLYETEVSLPELAETSLNLVHERARAGGLTLETNLPADLPPVFADERILKQILINLLSNAVKFTPSGGKISLRIERTAQGGLSMVVADTGIGMSEAEVEIALSAFGQVDSSLARQHQGTGLGLPLVRSLAELHGGTLRMSSETGTGTVATVNLPAERVLDDAAA
ncbi:MAG: PAS domain S-box protein [Alphaproteobacteria bacterium]